jgi:ATP-dependent Clp protease ATP-binding subunit ClpC
MPGRLGLYDDRAKTVLALAQDEAWRVFHHDSIGPEHLLLGVLREASTGGLIPDAPGSIGAVALHSLGLDLSGARKALEGLSGYGDPDRHLDEIPFTPEAFTVLDLAPAEAKALDEDKVTPTHVLLAVLREPGKAGAVLQSFGLSTDAVRQMVIEGGRPTG